MENKKVFKKIKIEIKPRLKACQFHFILDASKIQNAKGYFQITITKNKCIINSEDIILPFNILPESLSGLMCVENEITFRVSLNQNDGFISSSSVVLPSPPFVEPASKLQPNKSYMLHCFQCNSDILKKQILINNITSELTNGLDVSDIFCHRDKRALKFEKNHIFPHNDKYHSLNFDVGYFQLEQFDKDNLSVLFESNIIHCERCFSWLGILQRNKNYNLQLWNDTVKFSSLVSAESQKNISEFIFYKILQKVLVDCLFPICNVLLICKISKYDERSLLLTLLDRNVCVFECDSEENKFRKLTYFKILFKECDKNDEENQCNIHQKVLVSKPSYFNILKLLYLSSDVTSTSNEKLAYLRI